MIDVTNLSKYFGPVLAVDRISFQVDRGEIVGFLGPNGAGKTTTMRILTTFLPATSGVAKIAGFDVMTESMDVRRHLGYLPESVPLYPEMRVEEYLMFRAKLKGVERKGRQQRVDYCIDRCRVREVRRRLIGTLSKGYRQRVGLADAMIHDPDLLILDEPTVGLDPVQINETLELITELGGKHTVLLSTHILAEVEKVCERVIIISSGRIGLDKQMDDLSRDTTVITLEVRGPAERIYDVLKAVEGVADVQRGFVDGSVCGFTVRTHQDRDLRETISQRMTQHGWTLRLLDLRKRSLEDHFIDVVVRGQERMSA